MLLDNAKVILVSVITNHDIAISLSIVVPKSNAAYYVNKIVENTLIVWGRKIGMVAELSVKLIYLSNTSTFTGEKPLTIIAACWCVEFKQRTKPNLTLEPETRLYVILQKLQSEISCDLIKD